RGHHPEPVRDVAAGARSRSAGGAQVGRILPSGAQHRCGGGHVRAAAGRQAVLGDDRLRGARHPDAGPGWVDAQRDGQRGGRRRAGVRRDGEDRGRGRRDRGVREVAPAKEGAGAGRVGGVRAVRQEERGAVRQGDQARGAERQRLYAMLRGARQGGERLCRRGQAGAGPDRPAAGEMSRPMRMLAAMLVLLAAVADAQAASPTQDYLAVRDAYLAQFTGSGPGGDEPITAAHDRALGELATRLRGIIGPTPIKGFPAEGKVNLESLAEGDAGFGLLDGLVYAAPDGKTRIVVTTRELRDAWLAGHAH